MARAVLAAAIFAALSRTAHASARSECGPCHADVVAEWSGSMHRHSFSDARFLAEYRRQPLAFCRSCHAPGADAAFEPDAVSADEGVSCAPCHVENGRIRVSRGSVAAAVAAHEAVRDPLVPASRSCAPCHDFAFPDDTETPRVEYAPEERLQRTFREWASSDSARRGEGCVDCHMPWRRGPDGARHRDHRLRGPGDRAFLEAAVRPRVRARRVGDAIEVRAVLASGRIGHAFPTGDLFRRLELRVRAPRRDAVAAIFGRVFARRLRGERFLLSEVADERVPAPGTGRSPTRVFRFPDASRAEWSLDYLRRPEDHAAAMRPGENRVRIAAGEVEISARRR